jgi:hypothetical protein
MQEEASRAKTFQSKKIKFADADFDQDDMDAME